MAYIGKEPQFTQYPSKFFDGDGTAMTVSLDYAPPNAAALLVFIDGVRQDTSAYSLLSNSLTFTGNVPSGTNNVQVVHLGLTVDVGTPGDGTVTSAKIVDGAIVNADINASAAIAMSKLATDPTNASNIASGTLATARLGSGTADATTFLRGDNSWAEAGGGKVLQVVQAVKTDTFSNTGNTFVDITGLSVSITPSATSSKILIFATLNGSATDRYYAVRLVRDSTDIFIGDASSSRRRVTLTFDSNGSESDQDFVQRNVHLTYLDSPSTTSSTTYKPQIAMYDSSSTAYINRPYYDTDASWITRSASNIIAMEIAG